MAGKPNELVITRVYDAPVKLVWEAWTDLKHVEKWWGPRGFTITTKSKDLRPGGKWIYTMHGPDGTDYPNIATYHEVVKYEKLVYDHGGNEDRPKLFTVTVTFKEIQGKTHMTMISTLPTAEEAAAIKKFVRQAGGTTTWDRLGEYLETEQSGADPFFISHTIEANIETVFKMWVDPDQYAAWMGPEGGHDEYGELHCKAIRSPHQFVYVQNFSAKGGGLAKAPFCATYPDRLLTTVTLTEEDPNETRVTVRWDIFGEATEAERKTFHGLKAVMSKGWDESFHRMETLLAKKN